MILVLEAEPSRWLWLTYWLPAARFMPSIWTENSGRIPDQHDGVEIRKIVGDLQRSSFRLPPVDGILMANTLHFIQEQQALLRRLLSVADRFLIVEYERSGRIDGDHIRSASKDSANSSAGRSGARGETGDTAVAVWRHDVLGPRREIQTIILKTSESFFSPTDMRMPRAIDILLRHYLADGDTWTPCRSGVYGTQRCWRPIEMSGCCAH